MVSITVLCILLGHFVVQASADSFIIIRAHFHIAPYWYLGGVRIVKVIAFVIDVTDVS